MLNVRECAELQKLKHLSLSNTTVRRRITELSGNILSQVISKIHNSIFNFFAIQMDKTTDVANLAELCVYVRYVHNKHLEDEFLFCEILITKTTARKMFDKVDSFLRPMLSDGNRLLACAPAVLRRCLAAVPIFRIW